MVVLRLSRSLAIAASMLAACGIDTGDPPGPDAGVDPVGSTEFPCEAARVLQTCWGCHSSPPTNGAPMSLEHVADLAAVAPALTFTTSIGARAVKLLRDGTMPPAPLTRPNTAAIDDFAGWVDKGMLGGSCAQIPPPGPPDPVPAPTVCSSGKKWPVVWTTPSVNMNPGLACISCHKVQKPSRAYFFMGTVFPTLHEEDRCYSTVPTSTHVEILDATGQVAATLSVYTKGNFHSPSLQAQVTLPFTARVVTADGKVRQMMTPQMNGDCNACHTEQGANGAPGRIVLPK